MRLVSPDHQISRVGIINNQLGRRNLHPDQASYLRGKRYNAEKQDKGGDRKSIDQNDPLIESTADRLATEYKVSAPTIKRDGNYAAAVDTLQAAGIAPQGGSRQPTRIAPHRIDANPFAPCKIHVASNITPRPATLPLPGH